MGWSTFARRTWYDEVSETEERTEKALTQRAQSSEHRGHGEFGGGSGPGASLGAPWAHDTSLSLGDSLAC